MDDKKKAGSKKRTIRIAAVTAMLVCVIVPLSFVQRYLCFPLSGDLVRVLQFEKEPENSIDAVMIGSSSTYTGYSAAYAYKKYGYTSYPYALSGSYCNMWQPALQNILRTQKPKLVVVDAFGGGGYGHEQGSQRSAPVYMISAFMPLSADKIRMCRYVAGTIDGGDTMSLVFPLIKYHANYTKTLKMLKRRIAIGRYGPSPMKGIEDNTNIEKFKPLSQEAMTSESEALDKETEKIIVDFIDYCKEKDVEVLFVKYPFCPVYEKDFRAIRRQNRVLEIAESKGCSTLDLQTGFYETGLDPACDYGDRGHANVMGQKKITEAIGSRVVEQIGTAPSERDQAIKDEWDEASRYYDAFYSMSVQMIDEGANYHLSDTPEMVETVKRYMKDYK